MKYWAMGCGLTLILGIVAFFIVGNFISKKFSELGNRFQDTHEYYQGLNRSYPFVGMSGQALTMDQASRFASCRKSLFEAIGPRVDAFEQEDHGIIGQVEAVFDLSADLAQSHVDCLSSVSMSPREYYWILNQIRLVLRYGERDDAPAEIKALRASFDAEAERSPTALVFTNSNPGGFTNSEPGEMNEASFDRPSQGRRLNDLLFKVDAAFITLPVETLEAVAAHATILEETLALFRIFDMAFLDFYFQFGLDRDGTSEATPSSSDESNPLPTNPPQKGPDPLTTPAQEMH